MLIAFLFAAVTQATMAPPVHRVSTILAGFQVDVLGSDSGTLYYSSNGQMGAIELATGVQKWSRQTIVDGAVLGQGEIYALIPRGEVRDVWAVSLDGTGAKTIRLGTSASEIAQDGDSIYLLDQGVTIQAIDAKSGTAKWRTSLGPPGRARFMLGGVWAGRGKVYAGIADVGFHCLDARTGKLLWKKTPKYGAYEPPTILEEGVLTEFDDLALRDTATGEPIWTIADAEPATALGNTLLIADDKGLKGIELATGRQLWSIPTEARWSPRIGSALEVGGSAYMLFDSEFIKVNRDGAIAFKVSPTFTGTPASIGEKLMITSDSERIYAYAPGDYDKLPTGAAERTELARDMVAHLPELDAYELERLQALCPEATPMVIEAFIELAGRSESKRGRDSLLEYGLLRSLSGILREMAGPQDSEALLKALRVLGPANSYSTVPQAILGEVGDPDTVIPLYVEMLEKQRSKPGDYNQTHVTLDVVAKSRHPRAVRFMIDALNDQSAPESWRKEAFTHLAATGSEEAIQAIRAARAKRGPRLPWQELFIANLDTNEIGPSRQDAHGRTLRMVKHWALGNISDLYLQEKDGDEWGDPIFIGLYTSNTWKKAAPTEFRGITVRQFLESEWINILPNDTLIRADQDGDGLTDLVEARLGTDPNRRDTDEDGLEDAVDPCPNAAPRELGDDEKILAACLEAHFFGRDAAVPALLEQEKIAPFEMYGYSGFLLWRTATYAGSLPTMYGTGVNLIRFEKSGPVEGDSLISYSADRKKASTLISRYSGGLNGEGMVVDLIKIGDDWFVTDIRMAYVS